MNELGLDLLIPHLEPDRPYNEAALLGMIVWLLMRSPVHRGMPVHALQNLVIPAMKYRQMVLAREGEIPVFYCGWAWLDEAAENRYLDSPKDIQDADWNSGKRLWVTDWVAPFGHTRAMARFLRRKVFADQVVWSLQHKPGHPGPDPIRRLVGVNLVRPGSGPSGATAGIPVL
jgi:cytolysin-activating lysine-acyltransferase